MADLSGPPAVPAPLRAALGLVATVADAIRDGRGLPDGLADRAMELPVLAVSSVLQLSLRAQQQYAALTVRGEELLTQLRGGASDDPPPWAHFDDTPPPAPAPPAAPPAPPPPASPLAAAKKAPAKKATAAKKAPAKKSPANSTKKVPAPRATKPSAFDLIGD